MKNNFQLCLFVFFVSVFFHTSKKQSTIEIPLKILRKSNENYSALSKGFYQIKEKISPLSIFLSTQEAEKSRNVNLTDDFLLTTQIDIGNGQKFNIILGTGNIYFWVVGINSKDTYKIKNHYNSSNSPSSKNLSIDFDINYYTSGSIKGTYFSDKVKFFSEYSYELIFGVAYETDVYLGEADGIMGLAKNYDNNLTQSIIWEMYKNGDIPNKSFSFKYNSDEDIKMYIGEEHSDFQNNKKTSQCKLLNKTDIDKLVWTCELNSLSLKYKNKKKSALIKDTILFDISTNYMVFPLKYLNILSNKISEFNCFSEDYTIKCRDSEKLPDIYIELGNHYLILKKENIFSREYINNNNYYKASNIIFLDVNTSIAGYPFFKSFHTKFDPENNIMKFYSEDPNALIAISDDGDGNSEVKVLLIIFLIIIIIVLIIGIFLFMRFRRKKMEINREVIDKEIDSKTASNELM